MRDKTREGSMDIDGRDLGMLGRKGSRVEPVNGKERDHQGRDHEETPTIKLACPITSEEGEQVDKQVRGRVIRSGEEVQMVVVAI